MLHVFGFLVGFWWSRDLLANRSAEESIKKARGCFFHYGFLGSLQGDINPLSTKSVIDTCVMPVLLFGCENWILTEAFVHKQKSFLSWMTKRALKWPQHFSALVALGMESMKSRILNWKLTFLLCLLSGHCCLYNVCIAWRSWFNTKKPRNFNTP